jgi:negative regulator of flagellin synthesis FlgM
LYEAALIVALEDVMKIGQTPELPSSVTQALNTATQKSGQPATASAAANANAAKSTRSAGVAVTMSNQAKALEKAASTSEGDVDMQKVAAARSAIQEGTYTVNAEAIADKLLSNAQEMLSRTRR